ncbi:hypothetical protein SAMN05192533_108192 [Mesobacillus persicus]|uniref:DUF2325 domain-containing protein n=1 Tax=Mesobacillus persicus TaxID=930146 RepID=A0A1H8DES9_9BACI|nr:hypothetical protein [Mesobacillus persicus]SEN05841.1 hypothetical protein SAMN05192533_108192 [Mesobacillus persicus]
MTNIIENNMPAEILRPFLCIALGGNSFLLPFIDDYYKKNQWEYYEAYQKSSFKNNPLFSMYTTKSEEKIRQVAGMLEWSEQKQQFGVLDQLIKKGYKFVYQYIQRHKYIDFEHFMRSYAKRQKKNTVKEIGLLYHNIVLWYLCVRENKPFNQENVAWKSFQEVLNTSINEVEIQKTLFSEKIRDQHRTEIDDFYKEYHIQKNHLFDSLGLLLEALISSGLRKIHETHPDCEPIEAENRVFQESPAKYIGAIGGWLKTLNIHEMDATEQVSITKEDLDTIFLEILYAKKYNHLTKEEEALFFITCLYLKALGSLYHETKQLYLDQSKQDYYFEMKAKETFILEKETKLLQREKEFQLQNERNEKEIEGLTQELRAAQAKIRQLEQQLNETEDYSKEVHSLRHYVFYEEQSDQPFNSTTSMETMQHFIQTKKILIFGGHPVWQQKLRLSFPTIELIDVTEVNRDISKIQRADVVFINTKVFSHAFYKKVMKEVSRSDTPMYYLNGHNNMEKTIVEIYAWLTE